MSYVDVVFGVNAVIDYLLLQCSAKLGRRHPHGGCGWFWRPDWAACLQPGLFSGSRLQQWPMRLVALAGMLLLAFGTGPGIWRQGGLFVLSSLALAGLVLLVAAVFGWGLVILNQGAYYPVSWPALILTAGLGYLAADLFLRRAAQHGGAELVQTVICVQDKRAQITALRDTGNTLLDPMTGLPVLIVYWKAVAQVLPTQLQQDWLSESDGTFFPAGTGFAGASLADDSVPGAGGPGDVVGICIPAGGTRRQGHTGNDGGAGAGTDF